MRTRVLFVFSVLLCAHLLAILLVRLWQRRTGAPTASTLFFAAWTLGTYAVLLLGVFAPYDWRDEMRFWLYPAFSAAMVWNFLLLLPFTLMGVSVGIIAQVWSWWRSRTAKPVAPDSSGLSRRAFLYQLGLGPTPAVALGAGVHGVLTQTDLRVREFTVPIAHLPPELDGLVIAHVSDLHSGLYCGEKRLRVIRDATNDLQPDLIFVTGDVINDSPQDLPPALDALLRLRARFGPGPILCEGNHDIIPGPDVLPVACAQAGLTLLRGAQWSGLVRGARVRVAGLPWLNPPEVQTLSGTLDPFPQPRTQPELRITLAHHPDLFPQLVSGSDLVLSGHTHGGQIMFGPLGFGPLLFNYWSGLYSSGQSTLIVSNGCGDWFPCRIGAPAEIGKVVLKRV